MLVLGLRKTDQSVGGSGDLGAIFRGRLNKEAAAPCEMRLGPWENVTGEGQRRQQEERAVDPPRVPGSRTHTIPGSRSRSN